MTDQNASDEQEAGGGAMRSPRPSPWARPNPSDLTDASTHSTDVDQASPRTKEQAVNLAPAVIFFLVLMGAIQAIRSFLLPVPIDNEVLYWFAFVPEIASFGLLGLVHELWAAITYSLLHGGWAHYFMNAVWLAIFGSPLAMRIGFAPFVLFWVVTAFAAAAFHFAIDPYGYSILVGASGSISGMMGAAARLGFRIDRTGQKKAFAGRPMTMREVVRSRTVLGFIMIWLLVNILTGLFVSVGESAIAWQAHIGGFVAGFLILPFFPARLRRGPGI
ncbi:rhomboid family intramembrane serine protease [Notoacmeibacter ruber]|uniref:Rhomboid family intramembrane serine protease n=1 Tax=Notoacmeibacter ruber TaxID=2670375 RepID=A0A3L7JBE0_9HYPH|nr:rhomboid family intramembrane serine protease [Notoacmeibacter ruber]RLQ87749.1 rhomboid family intramembrane serine protease [Notoacmeibacter ruber]